MRKLAGLCLGLLLLVRPTWADEPKGRIIEESWNVAHLDGACVGDSHTIVREIERDGRMVLATTVQLRLTIRRGGSDVQLRMETGSEETADGKVTGLSMKQYQGNQVVLVMQGAVKDAELEVSVKGMANSQKKIPWDEHVIGLFGQEKLFQKRNVKPGDKFSFKSFEPMINSVVTNQVTVKDYEEVKTLKGKVRLLRIEEKPDKIMTDQGAVQMPGMVTWIDKDYKPVRSEFDMPLLGKMDLYRSEKQPVRGVGAPAPGKDILYHVIRLNRRINHPNQTRSAVYRITVKDEDDPGTTFAKDERQESKNVVGNSFELHVRASSGPKQVENPGKVKEEYLKTCFWINSDDARVKRWARQAVGNESDPWTKAQLIERWVHENMTVSFTEAFGTAGAVARTLRGDCRQHSMLASAMCRAALVPARTAIGLVYANDPRQGPVMAFHMWTEVAIDGQWIAIDATRGEGHVGATHLKVTDHSWYEETSMRPLLPVIRVLGKLHIEVVSVESAD